MNAKARILTPRENSPALVTMEEALAAPLIRKVIASFSQPESIAEKWTKTLAGAWTTKVHQLAEALRFDRETCSGPQPARRMERCHRCSRRCWSRQKSMGTIEAKLVKELDEIMGESGKGPGGSPAPADPATPRQPEMKLTSLKMVDSVPLPWPINKEAELGASKDKSGWRSFANLEHVNVFRSAH